MILQTVITLFNAKAGADRREVFFPTIIDSASYMSRRASSSSKGVHTEGLTYSLRIPVNAKVIDGKTYVDEKAFKAMSDEDAAKHWTLRTGDCILVGAYFDAKPCTMQELTALADREMVNMICINEYADNTIRGSEAVKHWRIGGV